MTWQLQDAKNKLSEVVDSSISKGPQVISRRGRYTAVLISYADYQRYIAPKKNLKKIMMSTGFDQLDLQRDVSTEGRGSTLPL